MKEVITLKSIADRAGVAPSTVSRIISQDKTCYINKAKKETILRLVRELGYSPNIAARNLVTGKTSRIAIVFTDIFTLKVIGPFFLSSIEGALKAFGEKNIAFSFVSHVRGDKADLQKICAAKGIYDGLIFGRSVLQEADREIVLRAAIPVVILDDEAAFLEGMARVITDKREGVFQAISYLKSIGHRRIAYYGCAAETEGYFSDAMSKLELHQDEALVFNFPNKGIYNLMLDAYLASKPVLANIREYTAIFCCDDFVAMGLNWRLKGAGIAAGKDISVMGFDDVEELLGVKTEEMFFTTVHNPCMAMGREVARLLMEMIKSGKKTETTRKLACSVVIRKSTNAIFYHTAGRSACGGKN